MKKLLVLLLVFSMSFSLVACNVEFGFNKEDSEETLTESEKDDADDISNNDENSQMSNNEEKSEEDSDIESEESKESEPVEETPAFIPTAVDFCYDDNNYYFEADSTGNGDNKWYQYNLATKSMQELQYEPLYDVMNPECNTVCNDFMFSYTSDNQLCLANNYTGETICTFNGNQFPNWYNDNILVTEYRDGGAIYLGIMNTAGEYIVPLHTNERFSTYGFTVCNNIILCYANEYQEDYSWIYDPMTGNYSEFSMYYGSMNQNFTYDKMLLTDTGLFDITTNTTHDINFDIERDGVFNTLYGYDCYHGARSNDYFRVCSFLQYEDYFIIPSTVIDNGDRTQTYTYSIYDYSGNLINEYTTLPISQDSKSFTISKDYYFYDAINPEDNYTYYYLRNTDGSLAIDPIKKEEWENGQDLFNVDFIDDDFLIGYNETYGGLKICDITTDEQYYYDYEFKAYDKETNTILVYATHSTYGKGYYIIDPHNPDVLVNPFE